MVAKPQVPRFRGPQKIGAAFRPRLGGFVTQKRLETTILLVNVYQYVQLERALENARNVQSAERSIKGLTKKLEQ